MLTSGVSTASGDDDIPNHTEEPEADLNGKRSILEQSENAEVVSDREKPLDVEVQVRRKRKRKNDEEDIEDVYMRRLERAEAREAELAAKSQDVVDAANQPEQDEADDDDVNGGSEVDEDGGNDGMPNDALDQDEQDAMSPPPLHETEQAADLEASKPDRTVFLGNVSTAAVSSKAARKTLINHLKSFFESVPKPKDGESKHAVESIRFRSTPYANSVPKKAAFATKQLMEATAKSTNAYAVYSSENLARAAAKQLNGSVVIERHLRVDQISHPSKVDHRRCVFVGNLGFVDDESNIEAANEEEGKEKRKPSKYPADVEEGLWRTFGKCGTVESVRVIRDSTTRVGKGIAYVQFDDPNAVEAALLHDGKKFPPMLPRKLRVSRAKAQKRNAKPGTGIPSSRPNGNGYRPKTSTARAAKVGEAGKLFGRAAAAKVKQDTKCRAPGKQLSNGIRKPEDFVFEGHRASSKSGKSGLKLAGRAKKKPGKPTSRSARRGAAFKATKKAK